MSKRTNFIFRYTCHCPCDDDCKKRDNCVQACKFLEAVVNEYGAEYMEYIIELYKAAGYSNPIRKFMESHDKIKWEDYGDENEE
ncbi:MAG TPA: hypothetical protein VK190_03585 [Pseudoneobacillus sp.]|nr:hypothetical protein [Pseudoneobacillus sp.]